MLDLTARRNLELTQTMRTGEKRGTLLWVLDKTKTAMGKRLLRSYLDKPLVNPAAINKRLNAVEELVDDTILRCDIDGRAFGHLRPRAADDPRHLRQRHAARIQIPRVHLPARCRGLRERLDRLRERLSDRRSTTGSIRSRTSAG